MKAVPFAEVTGRVAKYAPPQLEVPVRISGGETITCWRLTLWERVILVVTGRLWVRQSSMTPSVRG